jgi:prolyl-tRNA synthetase
MIMTHSDDSGLVLPPKIAPKQVVIVPIPAKKNDEEGAAKLEASLNGLVESLTSRGVRVKVDDRDYVRNGAKYFEWERKGVPLRIEIGPRDVKNDVCVFKWRKWKEDKETVGLEDAADKVVEELEQVSYYYNSRAPINPFPSLANTQPFSLCSYFLCSTRSTSWTTRG